MTLSRRLATLIVSKNVPLASVIESLRAYNQLSLLFPLKRHLESIAKEKESGDTLLIESPFSISDEALKNITRMAHAEGAPHSVAIKESLLAGFKARYKGKLYDGSAERIIKQLIS